MALITRLLSADLAKALGLREPTGPSELADIIVPVLSMEPYLRKDSPASLADVIPIFFGFETTNLANGQGVNVDARVAQRIIVHGIFGSYSMAILAPPAVAGLMQFLGYFYIYRQATPVVLAGNDSQITNQFGRDSAFDAPTVRSNVAGLTTNDGGFVATKFANLNAKTWVQTNGTGGAIHHPINLPGLELVLEVGDFIGAHVDIGGPVGSLPTEVQATLLISKLS